MPIKAQRTRLAQRADKARDRDTTMARDKIIMECTDCKDRNYHTTKNKRKHPQRVEWKKYCPRCGSHKLHKESR